MYLQSVRGTLALTLCGNPPALTECSHLSRFKRILPFAKSVSFFCVLLCIYVYIEGVCLKEIFISTG